MMLCHLFKTLYSIILLITVISHIVIGENDCPILKNGGDTLSQTQLLEYLTHGCRYDRLERPIAYSKSGDRLPIDVYARAYIYFMQNLEAQKFNIHALLQLRFQDSRLTFRDVAPNRQPILGEKPLRDTLWMPHIFLANERDSSILGYSEKDILTSISPDGTVIVMTRIKASLYCWMNLQKFPFDEQHCSTVIESWMYNTSELVLHWEQIRPLLFDPALHLTEYILSESWTNETVINADLNDLRHGAFSGNYSSLSFNVHLTREIGFYLMDYFLPSIMIVGISWVSFWLQADQAPPRIMLGTSTMLTFITLASAQGKNLPKVSYIKISEVWFLGCTCFIFGSLVEFAFVNSIWRRRHNVDVKKINSKHILKSTISPKLLRRRSHERSKSFSVMSKRDSMASELPIFNNYLTVHNFPITTIKEDENTEEAKVTKTMKFSYNGAVDNNSNHLPANTFELKSQPKLDIGMIENGLGDSVLEQRVGWTTLTPQQISMWIDAKARCVFPLCFLIFNIFFWTFVYIF